MEAAIKIGIQLLSGGFGWLENWRIVVEVEVEIGNNSQKCGVTHMLFDEYAHITNYTYSG